MQVGQRAKSEMCQKRCGDFPYEAPKALEDALCGPVGRPCRSSSVWSTPCLQSNRDDDLSPDLRPSRNGAKLPARLTSSMAADKETAMRWTKASRHRARHPAPAGPIAVAQVTPRGFVLRLILLLAAVAAACTAALT